MTRSLKEAAKKGDRDVCLILAKEVVHARKTVNKLHTAKESDTMKRVATVSIVANLTCDALVGSEYIQIQNRQHCIKDLKDHRFIFFFCTFDFFSMLKITF